MDLSVQFTTLETCSTAARVGASMLSKMYSGMCESPGDERTLTHHSLEIDDISTNSSPDFCPLSADRSLALQLHFTIFKTSTSIDSFVCFCLHLSAAAM